MNKLNIFWIEDNAKAGITDIEDFEKHLLPSNSFFNIYLFQHPIEVLEYLKLQSKVKSECGNEKFIKNGNGIIPDLIVFDYQLSSNFKINESDSFYYRKKSDLEFLRNRSAALKLKNDFNKNLKNEQLFIERSDITSGNIDSDDLKFEYLDFYELQGKVDQFGLYCGVSLLKEFNDYPSHAVPATKNFSNKHDLSLSSKFYEWINSTKESYSLNENVESKVWSDIFDLGLKGLRNRIIYQIASNKIIPNYSQLKSIIENIQLVDNRIFSFDSAYGTRHMSLDALFFDFDTAERNEKIIEWCQEVLKTIIQSSNKTDSAINNAINKYEKLYKKFQDHFLDRVLLSYFSKKEQEATILLDEKEQETDNILRQNLQIEINNINGFIQDYENEIKTLKTKFGVEKNKINNIQLICSVQKEYNATKLPIDEIRLLVLLLVTRLWIDYQITNEEKPLYVLEKEDYFNVLNPIINTKTDLILLMHCDSGKPSPDKFLENFQSFTKRKMKIKSSFWDFKWIDSGEKIILKSFFQEKLSKLNQKPNWLN